MEHICKVYSINYKEKKISLSFYENQPLHTRTKFHVHNSTGLFFNILTPYYPENKTFWVYFDKRSKRNYGKLYKCIICSNCRKKTLDLKIELPRILNFYHIAGIQGIATYLCSQGWVEKTE